MKEIQFPYGKGHLKAQFKEEELLGCMESKLSSYQATLSPSALVQESLEHPIGSPSLAELAKGKKKIVLISSDHTRPVPSKIITPLILKEIRRGNPEAEITILIATGCHRATTKEEMIERYGQEIVDREHIEVHDCDAADLVDLGHLPGGNRLYLNKTAAEADLLLAEGFIEPHFFAGFSGGRKAVLPGVSGRASVMFNHSAAAIAHDKSRTGILNQNTVHMDMCAAAERAKLAFIVNVVLNAKKEIVASFAGDSVEAHKEGVSFIKSLCECQKIPADIVITTNGGYPLDQNVYQSVKGMSTAELCCKDGGVILMLSQCEDGHGAESFYQMLAEEKDNGVLLSRILARSAPDTVPDQWQTQIFLRILNRFPVIFVSDADEAMIRDLHLIPAASLEEAIAKAKEMTSPDAKILAIPDGVSTIIKE